MTMPKTAVNKNNRSVSGKNQIGLSRQMADMKTVAKTRPMERSSNDHFGTGIARLDTTHNNASRMAIQEIGHDVLHPFVTPPKQALRLLRKRCNIGDMGRADSGRIVVDLEPSVKRRLYAALALDGLTLKDWLEAHAANYCNQSFQPGKGQETPVVSRRNGECYSIVSMFSGCGGMDLGFRGGFATLNRSHAKLPFEIVWANDLNKDACDTYRRNLAHDIRDGDVWGLLDTLPSRADVVIGGFPCQDISINGKRTGVSGERSGLYKAMVEAISRLRPKIFVAENVKGLLMKYNAQSLAQVIEDFTRLGYNVSYELYKAADYGVPQLRERVFIVGTSEALPEFLPPAPTHKNQWITASEALVDLEKAEEDRATNHVWSRAAKSAEQGRRRLFPNRPSQTIRAECHGNIQFHYKLPRRISMREAARLQSFPDDFIFSSGLRATERQVGNAVPPLLAWHIAKAALECLRGEMAQAHP